MKKDHSAAEGLVPAARIVEGEIVTANAYNTQVTRWRDSGFNVLTPAVSLSSIPRDHKMLVQQVQINHDPAGGEVYKNPLFTRDGEVALSKSGLEKIAQAAGITLKEIVRVDSRTVEHVYTYRVTGSWLGFDGNVIARIAHKTLDLRDGSPDIKGFTANQIEQARRHGEAVCESKAINRLYRQYGLRQKYQQQELAQRPFIVLKLQWEPDMSNPVVAAIVTQMKMGATQLLYPQGLPTGVDLAALPAHQVPPEYRPAGQPTDVDDDEPVNAGASSDDVPFTPTAGQQQSETEPLYHLTKVMRRKNGSGFYLLTKETGEQPLFTDNESLATVAHGALERGRPVSLHLERRGADTWVDEMAVPKADSGY